MTADGQLLAGKAVKRPSGHTVAALIDPVLQWIDIAEHSLEFPLREEIIQLTKPLLRLVVGNKLNDGIERAGIIFARTHMVS